MPSPVPGAPGAAPKPTHSKPPPNEVEAAPAAAPFTLSDKKPPQPWTPLGVGLGVGGLVLGSVLFLGRRFGW
jgi:hypothetical protein